MMFSRQLISFYEIPVAKAEVFWKLSTLFVRNRSMHLGHFGFLKHVFSITKFQSYFDKNSDRLDSAFSELKSPHKTNLSYFWL